MRVLVVSGIWPPDIGGPASHAPEVVAFLRGRGHEVEVVTTADASPDPTGYPVSFTSRRLPVGLRHLHSALLIARRARRADVVYSTGLFGRTALACLVARTPYALKLTADPAFERARARGRVAGDVDDFQHAGGSRLLRGLRDLAVRRAAFVFCPSAYLRELAVSWGARPEHVEVLPNPAPAEISLLPRAELRARLGIEGPSLAFAGRLTAQKALEVAFAALEPCADVTLYVAGEGPERVRLEGLAGERVRFLGPASRQAVLELFAAVDAAVLPSRWENFPHAVIEALAVGTPVIATDVGGVGEVVRDGENGLLVPSDDVEALTGALRRFFSDPALRERLRAAAAPSVAAYAPDRLYARLEAVLASAASRA